MFGSRQEWELHMARLEQHEQYRLLQAHILNLEYAFECLVRDYNCRNLELPALKGWVLHLYQVSRVNPVVNSVLTLVLDEQVPRRHAGSRPYVLSNALSRANID